MTFEAFAVSTSVVALGEMGDKTQIAAVMLAARYDALVTVTAVRRWA
jgi:putative Ca2+/H+ antiporter (TMEM165/GDT1 family)